MTPLTVLVVDDNLVNAKLARLVLEGEGFVVRTATSGREAIEMLSRDFSPDAVLTDLQMPDMDGFELTRRLKADPATRHLVVIALTAYAMKGDEARAREAGCDGYVAKPIDTRALAAQLRAIVTGAGR